LVFSYLKEVTPASRSRCSDGRVWPPEAYKSLASEKLWNGLLLLLLLLLDLRRAAMDRRRRR
jgi:hypothetical protein